MREILFRGRNPQTREWTEGNLVHLRTEHAGKVGAEVWKIHPVRINIDMPAGVDPETIGQYTGRKDKTGRKIFEGDVLKDCSGDMFRVYWNNDDCQYCKASCCDGTPIETSFDWFDADNAEVIGNIHDNPELLEVSDG